MHITIINYICCYSMYRDYNLTCYIFKLNTLNNTSITLTFNSNQIYHTEIPLNCFTYHFVENGYQEAI